MSRLLNKTILVTGAASGIGAEIARLFAQEGAFVILCDIDDNQGQQIANELGDKAIFFHLNVAEEKEWQTLTKLILEKYHHTDVLINNAGIIGLGSHFGPQNPEECSLEDWHHIHAVNLDGVFLGCKYAIKMMKPLKKGSIINVSSRSGLVGIPAACAYASSKAAVRNHTKSVALYLAQKDYQIRCNSLHPAAILTPMWLPILGEDKETAVKNISSQIPLKHMGKPMDVAQAALYLASDESSYVTGIELTIDGGILAGSSASPTEK